MQTIKNDERGATITSGNFVIFTIVAGRANFVSRRKPARGYKTEAGALRAAKRWLETGK